MKVGDLVECVDFSEKSGSYFLPDMRYRIIGIKDAKDEGRALFRFGHTDDEGRDVEAYASRFKLANPAPLSSLEYEDIMAGQEIYSELEGSNG